MGADNFINIAKWKDGQELLERYNYIVLDREDIDLAKYANRKNISIIKNETYNTCSSSEFRGMFKEEKRYNKEIIPDLVIDYILENGLYKI